MNSILAVLTEGLTEAEGISDPLLKSLPTPADAIGCGRIRVARPWGDPLSGVAVLGLMVTVALLFLTVLLRLLTLWVGFPRGSGAPVRPSPSLPAAAGGAGGRAGLSLCQLLPGRGSRGTLAVLTVAKPPPPPTLETLGPAAVWVLVQRCHPPPTPYLRWPCPRWRGGYAPERSSLLSFAVAMGLTRRLGPRRSMTAETNWLTAVAVLPPRGRCMARRRESLTAGHVP